MPYLYFAPNIEKSGIKIGFSKYPDKRLDEVVGDIDYNKTYLFKCDNANAVEDFCHKYFKDFKVNIYESGDGHTEWFNPCISTVAKELVLKHSELLGITEHFKYLNEFSYTGAPRYLNTSIFAIQETYEI